MEYAKTTQPFKNKQNGSLILVVPIPELYSTYIACWLYGLYNGWKQDTMSF